MGGGHYSQDVAREARSSNRAAFAYDTYQQPATGAGGRTQVHPALDPNGKVREVNNVTPIVVALDVTRSRGEDTKLVYDKLPMLMGQIELKGYIEGPGISFCAIGDANSDRAPLQVGQFEADNRLDEVLERFWIEEGGGGTGQESYELAAWFYSRTNCVRLAEGTGKKGYFFFVGDEGFYPTVDKQHVRRLLGEDLERDVDSAEAFRRLQDKFHVFFIHPKKSLEDRKGDIDAEIRSRVTAAGGQYDGVDIRASLIWNDRNDLDLHVIPPSGEEVYYGHKRSACGGWLDVDMNVRGETEKPVENVRWARGQAPAGRYRVYVQNFAFKEAKRAPTPFRVELEVNGRFQHVDGVVSPNGETRHDSNVTVFDFEYDPGQRQPAAERSADPYHAYSDEVILAQWATVIPREHILRIEDPKSIIDVILGALAIADGKVDLEGYLRDMTERGQGSERVAEVGRALAGLTSQRATATIVGDVPAAPPGGRERPRTTRL